MSALHLGDVWDPRVTSPLDVDQMATTLSVSEVSVRARIHIWVSLNNQALLCEINKRLRGSWPEKGFNFEHFEHRIVVWQAPASVEAEISIAHIPQDRRD
jgi:hypothetical protein